MTTRTDHHGSLTEVHVDVNGVYRPPQQETELKRRKISKDAAIDGPSSPPVPPPQRAGRGDLLYGVDDTPPWYTALILGLQHYLLMFGGTISLPLIVTPAMCIGNDDVGKSEVIGTALFVSGVSTLLQSTLGTRLPIVQGGSFAFLPPMFAILALPKWKCPDDSELGNLTEVVSNSSVLVNETLVAWRREVWTSRMREVQGAIVVASLFQVVVGLTGLLGFLLRFIGPLAIAPTICLIGLHLYIAAADYCAGQWGIAALTMVLITLFSQYLRDVQVPLFRYSRLRGGCHRVGYPVFKLLPVLLAMVISWAVCAVLTAADVFPADPDLPGYRARTDTKLDVLYKAQWFRVPYPGQWGLPTVSTAAVLGMLAGVVSGMIESVGDYYACARLSSAPPPPIHAINRGVFFEGVGVALAGLFGSGSGVTSFSENIGAIGITKVASRRVIQVGALMMLFFGTFGKFGALFVTIPEPIIGGIFMVVFGMITAVGVSNLQFVDLNSSRNLFIFGFAVFMGLSLPSWVGKHPQAISTGVSGLDQVLTVLLSTNMFVGGFVGFFLDNTIPGTPEERGIVQWRSHGSDDDSPSTTSAVKSPYDFPFGMTYLRRSPWARHVPIFPTYSPTCCRGGDGAEKEGIDNPGADIPEEKTSTSQSVIDNTYSPQSVIDNAYSPQSVIDKTSTPQSVRDNTSYTHDRGTKQYSSDMIERLQRVTEI